MGRRRAFQEDDVVAAAMELFWRDGYEHTSVDDVIAQAGISKSSFYSAFAGKHDLLVRALGRYGETWMAGLFEPMSRPGAGRAEIEEAFATLATRFAGPMAGQGCLMTNCAIDVAPHDQVLQRHTRLLRGAFEAAMTGAVARGQADGTITKSESAAALARVLVNALNGMSVYAKLDPDPDEMREIAWLSLKILNDPNTQPARPRLANTEGRRDETCLDGADVA